MLDSKTPVDVAAIATLGASFVSILPQIATVFTIVWLAIRIWETDTVQRLLGRKGKRDDRC